MTHLRLAAILIAALISFQIYAAADAQANNWQPPTSVKRTVNIPNSVKNKFTTNDDELDSRLSQAARQRMARENRRNHNARNNRQQQQSQNANDDDRTQGEDKFATPQRQMRQRPVNNNRLTRQGSNSRQSVNSQSGLND